jgi:type II secretory pathway component HofQ
MSQYRDVSSKETALLPPGRIVMSKRSYFAAALAAALLAIAPSASRAQTAREVTVEWQNAPLSQVVRAFAALSGRTIVVAPEVGDPELTVSLRNVEWQRALDLVLVAHALVARVDASGVIHVEKQASPATSG